MSVEGHTRGTVGRGVFRERVGGPSKSVAVGFHKQITIREKGLPCNLIIVILLLIIIMMMMMMIIIIIIQGTGSHTVIRCRILLAQSRGHRFPVDVWVCSLSLSLYSLVLFESRNTDWLGSGVRSKSAAGRTPNSFFATIYINEFESLWVATAPDQTKGSGLPTIFGTWIGCNAAELGTSLFLRRNP